MASIQSSLAVIQQVPSQWVTDISNQITSHVSETISSSFNTALDNIRVRFDRPIIDITDYSAAYGNIENSISDAVQAQQNLTDATAAGTEEAKKQAGVWEKVTAAFGKAKGAAEKVKGVAEKVLVPAAEQQKWEDMFQAKTGNDDVGTAMFEKFKGKALKTGQDLNKSMEGVFSLYPGTKNTGQLDKLMEYSTRISAMSPEGKDIGDTSSAIASAFEGDTKELAPMLQLDEEDLGGLQIVAKTENMEAFLSTLGDIMTTAGMTSASLQTMMDSPVNQWEALLGNYKNSLASMGEGALQALAPLLTILNQAFADGTFQPIIEGISIGLTLLAQGFYEVAQGALWLWSVLSSTLPVIIPILLGIVAGIIAYKIAMIAAAIATNMTSIATKIAAVAQGIYNAVLMANPIALIIGLIIGLIVAILGIVAAIQPVRDFIAGVYQWLGQATAAAVGFSIDLWTGLINAIIDVTNFLLSGINKVVGAVGSFLGIKSTVDIELDKVDSSKFKETVKNGITNFADNTAASVQQFSMENLKDKIGLGGSGGNNQSSILNQWDTKNPGDNSTVPKIPNTPKTPENIVAPVVPANSPLQKSLTNNSGYSNINNINKVNEVGSINEKVDISSDDLDMLRDLAEIQSIQNFVELTPTVQVTTGNINNSGDIDSIITKIGQKLKEEFVSTAQGVYT